MASSFAIRPAILKDLDWIQKTSNGLGWRPGREDQEAFWAADNTGFFIGELNGQIISCVSFVKYDSSFAFVGLYIVDEPYRNRGLGYGLKTFQAGMASLPEGCNAALESLIDKESVYQRSGFIRAWVTTRRLISVSTIVSTFSNHAPIFGVTIKTAQEIALDKIIQYDSECFQVSRPAFMEKWINLPGRKSFVAINEQGEVVGIIVARPTVRLEKDGYRIGPLFADNDNIASALLKSAAEAVIADESPQQILVIDIPDFNEGSVKIVDDLHAGKDFECIRMFTKDPLQYPKEKIYGLTSLELG